MGFINYDNVKKDNYEDLVEYTSIRRQEEKIQLCHEKANRWLYETIDDKRIASLSVRDLFRTLVVACKALSKHRKSICSNALFENLIDDNRLWLYFVSYTVYQIIENFDVDIRYKRKLMDTFIGKIFVVEPDLISDDFYDNIYDNKAYRKYFDTCFSLLSTHYYWDYLAYSAYKTDNLDCLQAFIKCYYTVCALIGYYIFVLTENTDEKWMVSISNDLDKLSELHKKYEESCPIVRVHKLFSPSDDWSLLLNNLVSRCRKIIFDFENYERADDYIMIKKIYTAFQDGTLAKPTLTSIFPSEYSDKIKSGTLCRWMNKDTDEPTDEESLYYIDHAVVYSDDSNDEENEFRELTGRIYVTDSRVCFRGNSSFDVNYTDIRQMVLYENSPELVEICAGKRYVLLTPEAEVFFKTVKLISEQKNCLNCKDNKSQLKYQELIEASDVGSQLFALEYISGDNIFSEMKSILSSISQKVRQLNQTAAYYPEIKTDVDFFIGQYLPEMLRLLISYKKCCEISDDIDATERVKNKIFEAAKSFDEAAFRKNYDIINEQLLSITAESTAFGTNISSETAKIDKLPFSYEELTEKTDINMYIVDFEYVYTYNLPEKLHSKIADIIHGLNGLKKTIETYPDSKKEMIRFFSYYIPETLRVIVSFNSYQQSGIDDKVKDNVFGRVMSSVDTLKTAIDEKINDIYQYATMNTVAQAEALQKIMHQDGFLSGTNKLKL